jgi:uncharacterized membrane protein SpoIIM required for sporulation
MQGMDIDDALRSGFSVLVSRPGGVLPFYLFEASTLLIARVPLFIGAALVFAVLVSTGQLAPAIREIQALNLRQLSPPITDPSQFQELFDALAGLVTPATITITVISLLLCLVLLLITRSVATAGTLHADYAGLTSTGTGSLSAGVEGIVRDTLRFIGLQLLFVGLVVLVSLPLISVLLTINGLTGIFLLIAFGLFEIITLIAISIALLFAEQAIVVDNVGVLDSVRHSVGFLRERPAAVIAYIGIVILVGICAAILFAIVFFFSISRVAVLFSVLAISPYLDIVKIGLYTEDTTLISDSSDFSESDPEEIGSTRSVGTRFVAAFRNGWSQLIKFIPNHPSSIVLSLGIFILGITIGWVAVSGFSVPSSPATDVRNVFGPFPVDVFVQIAANNWYVAAHEIFAGLAFAVPTITNLLLNGLLVGVLGGLSPPVMFTALVLPHGIIEIPALALAGGVGLHLGRVVWRGLRGRITTDEVASEIGQAYEILLGLTFVFVVAAFIEVFITPWIASVVLAGMG